MAARKAEPQRAPARKAPKKAAPQPKARSSPKAAAQKPKASGQNPKVTAKKPKTKSAPDARALFAVLRARHHDAHCELDHENPFQLVIATVLSAQSTDVMVNRITPELFQSYPTPEALARAEQGDVEAKLNKIGMFRQKARNIIGLSKRLVERHGGAVPRTLAELVELPGVGRKTANVVLGVAFGAPEGVVVDTHVQRISQRLGLTRETEPVEIEQDLIKLFPREDWDMLSHVLIFHGRRLCTARAPACPACPVNQTCPSAFHAENIGRKAPRLRT
jgi:endonuclease III